MYSDPPRPASKFHRPSTWSDQGVDLLLHLPRIARPRPPTSGWPGQAKAPEQCRDSGEDNQRAIFRSIYASQLVSIQAEQLLADRPAEHGAEPPACRHNPHHHACVGVGDAFLDFSNTAGPRSRVAARKDTVCDGKSVKTAFGRGKAPDEEYCYCSPD